MRQTILFIVIAIAISLLNRRRSAGTGPPVARRPGPGRIPTFDEPGRTTAPAPPAPEPPTRDRGGDVMAKRMRELVERGRDDLRRRAEAEADRASAERAAGPHTEAPGGIDPRLLDKDRTPTPTPDPIHPR